MRFHLSLDFFILLVILASEIISQILSATVPQDPTQAGNVKVAATAFGITGYGLLTFMLLRTLGVFEN